MDQKIVKTKKFRSEELQKVLEIERNCFREPWSPYTFEYIAEKTDSLFLVAEKDEEIVGYIISTDSPLDEVRRILDLAVEKKHRRQGIGSLLVQSVLDENKEKVSRIILEVRPSNLAAIGLYSKFGFKLDRVIPNYYQDGEDAYLMSKSVNT